MNKNELTTATILSAILISSLLATAFILVWSMNFTQKAMGQAEETFGENATFTEEAEGQSATANETTAPTTTAPTTTAPTPTSPPASGNVTTNVTSDDIDTVHENLNTAREGIQDNDSQAALDSLNAADSALFAVIIEEPEGPVADQLSALQGNIGTARESVQGNDHPKALQDLNAADSQVLVITEMLPLPEEIETDED